MSIIDVEGIRANIKYSKEKLTKMNVDLPKLCVQGKLTTKEVHETLKEQKKHIKSLETDLKRAMNEVKYAK